MLDRQEGGAFQEEPELELLLWLLQETPIREPPLGDPKWV